MKKQAALEQLKEKTTLLKQAREKIKELEQQLGLIQTELRLGLLDFDYLHRLEAQGNELRFKLSKITELVCH